MTNGINRSALCRWIAVLVVTSAFANGALCQPAPASVYRATAEKRFDLIHTRLEASINYANSTLRGNVSITLRPHFYPADSLVLDAKGMDIYKVSMTGRDLPYRYNGMTMTIALGRLYKATEQLVIDISYLSKPSEYKGVGSAAITDARGLYFINPLGKEKNKPTQVWTQGETEGTSVWCPTLDRPNQKSTTEMILTVPAKYISLSNGALVNQRNNSDGTRTDHWKMDKPHAPYLFFIGIGDYSVVKDNYNGMDVSYYIEKPYESVARKIFGNTPEMISFFEKVTGMKYPWNKYAQMTARDYVSGAMENTTATLHSSKAQQDARELVDENAWEDVVAHELFHHWFGDYVTAESWSNLSMNESFADYSEYLWREHKYGADNAFAHLLDNQETYLADSSSFGKDLIRFYYDDREDMFDNVSYQKGGSILHMLRTWLGDSAFFKGLNRYLTVNPFGTGEAHQLRLALEEVSGKDLNWFFNQWFFSSGNPVVDISYNYNTAAMTVTVTIAQLQEPVFQLPLQIDVYEGTDKKSYSVWVKDKTSTFTFPYTRKPDLVNVDANKFTLWLKRDNKSLDNYIFQYNIGNFLDRREAVYAALVSSQNPKSVQLIRAALKDKSEALRSRLIYFMSELPEAVKTSLVPDVLEVLKRDKPLVQAEAIDFLASFEDPQYKEIFTGHLNDSSYTTSGNALMALSALDPGAAETFAITQKSKSVKGNLAGVVSHLLMNTKNPIHFDFILNYFAGQSWDEVSGQAQDFSDYLIALKDDKMVLSGINMLANVLPTIPSNYKAMYASTVIFAMKNVADKKRSAGKKKLASSIDAITPDID